MSSPRDEQNVAARKKAAAHVSAAAMNAVPPPMAPRIRFLKLQHEDACTCGNQLLIGDRAAFDRITRRTLCVRCAYREVEHFETAPAGINR
jgi:hypothetical protein